MQKKRALKKSAFFVVISLLIASGCLTSNIHLRLCEGILIFVALYIMIGYFEKKIELKNLSIDYDNQKQLLYDIFEYCPDLIFHKDKNFKYTDCNKAFLDINGFNNVEEVIGKSDFDLWEKEKANEIRKHDKFILKQGKKSTNYRMMPGSKAKNRIFETTKAPLIINGEIVGLLGISRDMTENNNLQNSLLEKQAQLTAILDSMPFIAYLKDINGKLTIGNRNFNELAISSGINTHGLNLADLYTVDTTDKISDEDKRIIENKEIFIIEKMLETPNGKLWLEIHKAPIFNEKQGVTGIVVIIKNITADKEIEVQKETFVATLTHDLKTPTSAQIRALSLLLNESFGGLKKEQKQIVEQTLNSCKYMFNMISTILSTYKHDHGKTTLKYETFSLVELITESQNEISYLAKEKNQTISNKILVTDDEIVADKMEIKRVIINLLANAISYATTNSEIEILLRETQSNILFEIKNNSSHILKEDLNKLFDKYFSNATKFRQVGTGLGLYLSKQIIKNHGGTMIAESEKEIGNTFGFMIPKTGTRNKNFKDLINTL